MRNLYQWISVAFLFIAVWFTPFSASAQLQQLFAESDYYSVACPASISSKKCIRLTTKQGRQIHAGSLAKKFGLTDLQLRENNPERTLIVCRDAVRRTVWHMAPVNQISDRASNQIWESCPSEDREVVTIPGETLNVERSDMVADVAVESPNHSVPRSDPKSASVDADQILSERVSEPEPLVLKSESSQSDTAVETKETSPVSVNPSPTVTSVKAKNVVQVRSGNVSKLDILLFLITAVSLFLIVSLLIHHTKLQKQFTKLQKRLRESKTETHFQERAKQDLERDMGFVQARLDVARIEVLKVTDLLSEQDKRVELLTTERDSLTKTLLRIVEKYAPGTSSSDAPDLVRTIEDGFIRKIAEHVEMLYGEHIYPTTTEEAFRMLNLLESTWHKKYTSLVEDLRKTISSDPTSTANDPSGFTDLASLKREIRLCQMFVKNEMGETGEPEDLSSLLLRFVSALSMANERADKAERDRDMYRNELRETLKAIQHSVSTHTPTMRPSEMMPCPASPSELPSATSVRPALRVVSGTSGSSDGGPNKSG
jgi:hypothetical protein